MALLIYERVILIMRKTFWIFLMFLLIVGCKPGADKPAQDTDPVSYWITQLEKGNHNAQVAAAYGLGLAGHDARQAESALVKAAKTDNTILRKTAIESLSRLGPESEEAVQGFINALKDK